MTSDDGHVEQDRRRRNSKLRLRRSGLGILPVFAKGIQFCTRVDAGIEKAQDLMKSVDGFPRRPCLGGVEVVQSNVCMCCVEELRWGY